MGGKHKRTFSFFHAILLMAVLAFSGIYIFEANSLIQYRFAQERIEKDIAKLYDETRQSEIKFSEVSSLNNLRELSSTLNLTEAKNISYIQVKGISPLVLGN